ncbi:MAG: gluconate 2-dehydrogenase subunit 3 family protein [Bacteroidota bacterium]
MDRRNSIKTLLLGSLAGATLTTAASCTPEEQAAQEAAAAEAGLYGRTPKEKERDQRVKAEVFLNEHELATIAVLCDIILPSTKTAGSAVEAGVPEFIEFIVKDLPSHQVPMRGGLMWLDQESNRRYNKEFIAADIAEQLEIIDDIAYPDPNGDKPEMSHGIKFFDRMRNLVVTGYYTSKMGIEDLGYQGNVFNIWDGVPEEVLAEYKAQGIDYEPEWIAKCVDNSQRDVIAEWDDKGNLLT